MTTADVLLGVWVWFYGALSVQMCIYHVSKKLLAYNMVYTIGLHHDVQSKLKLMELLSQVYQEVRWCSN